MNKRGKPKLDGLLSLRRDTIVLYGYQLAPAAGEKAFCRCAGGPQPFSSEGAQNVCIGDRGQANSCAMAIEKDALRNPPHLLCPASSPDQLYLTRQESAAGSSVAVDSKPGRRNKPKQKASMTLDSSC